MLSGSRLNRRGFAVLAAATAAVALPGSAALAVDGTYNVTTSGVWSNAANWSGGLIADGAASTANFAADITATTTVTLDSSRTIGNLFFDDIGTAASDSQWTLTSSGGSILTLDNGGSTSLITNNNNNLTAAINPGDLSLGVVLAGAANVQFNNVVFAGGPTGSGGVRTTTITAANTYSGTTTLVNGNFTLNNGLGIVSGANSGFGNATSAIIFGNASSVPDATGQNFPNLSINLQSGTDGGISNRTISRNIDSSTTLDGLGRSVIRFNNNGSTASGALTITSNWALGTGATRNGWGYVAQRYGQTVDMQGVLSGGNAAVPFRVNDFGNGIGSVRFGNNLNSFADQVNVTIGTLIVGGDAALAGGGTAGTLGTNNNLQITESGNAATIDTRVLTDGGYTVAKNIILANSTTTNNAYVLGGTSANTSSFTGTFTVAGNTAAQRTLRLSQVAGGTTNVTGNIGPNGTLVDAGTLSLQKIEAGTAAISGANTYDGTTSVLNGTLLVNNVAGSGTGAGAVTVTSAAAQALSTSAGTAYVAGGVQTITLASVAGLVEGESVTSPLTAATVGQLGVGVGVGTTGGSNPGTAGTNPFAPGTYIQSINAATGVVTLSRPLINGVASGQEVDFGATTSTLGGTGLIAGAVTVNAGAFLAPGAAASTGVLTVGSAVISGSLLVDYNVAAAVTTDLLTDVGALSLSAASTLTFNNLGTGALTAPFYTLATYLSLTGTFLNVNNLPTGYVLNYNYLNGNDIALVATGTPEPASLGLLAGGASLLLTRRRRAAV